MGHASAAVLLGALLSMPGLALAQAPVGNRPPVAQPIKAVLVPPVTTFTITASDPDGDDITYAWTADIGCGLFRGGHGASATWSHPEGNPPLGCPHDQGTSHPGEIYVVVSDGTHTVTCSYDGSESGTGLPCITSTVGPRSGYQYAEDWWDDIIDEYNSWLYAFHEWVLFPLLIAIVLLPWYFLNNGLFIGRKKEEEDPCAKLRKDEEDARAKYNAAQAAKADLDAAQKAVADAHARTQAANRAAAAAAQAAGGRWSAHGSTDYEGEHIEVHKEGWQDKEKGKAADAAAQSAKDAKAASDKADADYQAKGGDAAWQKAKADVDAAKAAWEKAAAALSKCISCIGVPPAPTPPAPATPKTDGGTTGGDGGGTPPPQGGMTTDGPKTPPVTPPEPPKKPEHRHVCDDGDERNATSRSITVDILDLPSVVLKQDKIYSDAGNEAMKFVDYLQTIKDLFLMGKAMKGGVDGYLEHSLDGAADAVGLPDFLTWYDKGIDELTKSMHQLFLIMQDKQRLGSYWLEYRTKRLTLTCTSKEVCAGNRWVKQCGLTVQDGGFETHRTDPEEVFEAREVQRAITRLFTKLRNRYKSGQTTAKQFTDSCNKCE